jgi:hypothetical protein
MARRNAVTKYLAEIGRRGGKASGKARMEKLTTEQRVAVARTAAAARWARPVSQAELQEQSVLQDAGWTADRAAQMGAEDINVRLAGGATVKPGKMIFDRKLKMAKKATVNPSADQLPLDRNKKEV